MKKSIFTFFLFLSVLATAVAQGGLKGIVVDDTNEPIIGATVALVGTTTGTVTEYDGSFELMNLPAGAQTVSISYMGYSDYNTTVTIGNEVLDLGTISLKESGFGLKEVVVTGIVDVVKDRRTPVAVSTISNEEIQAKAVGNVEFPEVMKNTPSVYVSNQTGFGDAQMFTRGFNQSNTAFLLNGQPINGMEDGKMYWSNWSGMSDVANAVQVQRGLGSSKLAISSVGGTINILTKTIDNKKGGFVRTMFGNDTYMKYTASYSTGMMGKWAVSALVDHWQANKKWADGTWGSGQNYFLSIGFKPSDKHTFNFLVTGAPQSHGNRWSQSEDKLKENPKYNQHWNDYNGERISERFNYYHKPILNLSWDYAINSKSSLSSVLYASFGRGGGTGPFGKGSNKIKTADGRPDFDATEAQNIANNADGIGSFGSAWGRRASVNNHQWYGNVTNFKTELTENLKANLGVDVRFYKGDHFRQLVNMFGLKKWRDTYKSFRDEHIVTETYKANPWSALFNYAGRANRVAYDYSENINYQGLFGQLEYSQTAFSAFVQAAVSNQSYQRTGRWAMDNVKSKTINKLGFNVKGGASYSINLNNVVFANAGYYSRQPFLDNIFDNVRYSNDIRDLKGTAKDVENEGVIGLELGYKFFTESFSANVNLYRTDWSNRTIVYTFDNKNGTDDRDDDFEQRNVQRGIRQIHSGVELDLKYSPIEDLDIKAYGSIGNWLFKEMKAFDSFNEDTGDKIKSETNIDLSDVHVPNAPQTSFGLGLNYKFLDGFSAFLDMNYFDRIYRRDNYNEDDDVLRADLGTLDPYVLFDLGVGYEFPINTTQKLGFRANVYNVFNTDYLNQTDPYGVLNGNGTTWNISAKYSF